MEAGLLLAALAAIVVVVSAQSTTVDQNTYYGMARKSSVCATTYTALATKYYASNPCKDAVFDAISIYDQAKCPSTAKSSVVWTCMNGYNETTGQVNQALIDDWVRFLKNCDLFYIANRADTGESEDAYTRLPNSCFPSFNDMPSFITYLKTGESKSGSATKGSSNVLSIVLGVLLTLALLLP